MSRCNRSPLQYSRGRRWRTAGRWIDHWRSSRARGYECGYSERGVRSEVTLDAHFVPFGKVLNTNADLLDDTCHVDTQDGGVVFDERPCLLNLVVDGIEGGSVDFDEELVVSGPWDGMLTDDKLSLL